MVTTSDLPSSSKRYPRPAILRNLVGNAIKFTPPGQDGHISVGCEEHDGKVFISVNDTGTGISAEKLDKRFALEKRPERGTAGEKGVGLASSFAVNW